MHTLRKNASSYSERNGVGMGDWYSIEISRCTLAFSMHTCIVRPRVSDKIRGDG